VRKDRLVFLLGSLLVLSVCYLAIPVVSTYEWRSTKKPALWLTHVKFDEYLDGQRIALPDGGSVTIQKARIESLSIEPANEAPESKRVNVSFVLTADQGRYGVQGLVSLYTSDIYESPVVNLCVGWYVTKK
jgi:hypothetical protein